MSVAGAPRRRWTRDELVCVLSLYCRLPFGQFHFRNAQVIALATQLDRTPSAVAMKLANLASFDPAHRDRGVGGLSGASRLDQEVWDECYGRWDRLAACVEPPPRVVRPRRAERTEARATVTLRRGQAFFRQAVLAAADGQCCISGIRHESLLRASHIVPWAVDESLRLDPSNGLCLSALHDAAFDRGLMTIRDDLTLAVSEELRTSMPADSFNENFGRHQDRSITMPERFQPSSEALAYHREHIFRGVA